MLFILVLILPFEIRDMKLDFKNLKTLPQEIGIEKTKKVGFVLLLFSLTMEFLITTSLSNKNIYLLISFILLLFLMRSSQNQSKFYSSFWVESLPILWWILILIL
jgi:1,4-dihydroxy-2-naphthoate octaprenyltransferase